MKAVKFVLILAVMLAAVISVNAQKKGEKTVVFNANLHCNSCKAKVEKNIPYEKGVKDLKIDMKKQTITITFREDKNNAEGLQKAIEKLGIEVKGLADCPGVKSCDATKKDCQSDCCGKEKKEKK